MNKKKVLLLGGTGAMGVYLVPSLVKKGYKVDVVALGGECMAHENVRFIKGNAMNRDFLTEILKNKYDAIVDFLIYGTPGSFESVYELLLQSTDHYIFLSTYRVYADSPVITENSPRLLDVSTDKEFLATYDYGLYKAIQEDVLRNSKYKNWTIVRPTMVFSKFRFQLFILEADTFIYRALKNLPVYIPQELLSTKCALTWSGDVAKMFTGLILNKNAFSETYTLATAESRTWGEIADYYKEIIGLNYIPVSSAAFLGSFMNFGGAKYQLIYDRAFNRVVDNSKILNVCGMKQSELSTVKDALKKELSAIPKDMEIVESEISKRMTQYHSISELFQKKV